MSRPEIPAEGWGISALYTAPGPDARTVRLRARFSLYTVGHVEYQASLNGQSWQRIYPQADGTEFTGIVIPAPTLALLAIQVGIQSASEPKRSHAP